MSDPTFYISTPRLYLSYYLPSSTKHRDFMLNLFNSPSFLAAVGDTNMRTPELAEERIKMFVDHHEKFGFGQYLVSIKPEESENDEDKNRDPLERATPIGSVSLLMRPGFYTAPDIGFAITPEAQGKGYAQEAVRFLLQYAKEKFGITEVLGFCNTENQESKRVMTRCGMVYKRDAKMRRFQGRLSSVFVLEGMGDLEQYGFTEEELRV